LTQVSQPLESELSNGKKKIGKKVFKNFYNALEGTLRILQQLEPKEQSQAEELNYSKIKLPQSLIDSMKKDVKNGMLMDLEEYFSQMEATGSDGQRLAAQIKKRVSQYDDEGILKILETIEKGSKD